MSDIKELLERLRNHLSLYNYYEPGEDFFNFDADIMRAMETIEVLRTENERLVEELKEVSEVGAECYNTVMKKNGEIIEIERKLKRATNMVARTANSNDELQKQNAELRKSLELCECPQLSPQHKTDEE